MMLLFCNQGHENLAGSRFCLQCGEPLWLPVGLILETRYRIVRQLGQGGFGRTYLAEDLHRFNERCVLKEFAPQVQGAPELQKAKELFQREAGALYKLYHPQLPKFREFFEAKLGGEVGCLFLAQDYIEGQTYCLLLKSRGRLSEAEVTKLMYQLLPLLSYIHSQGVIHRDISPDNLILRHSDQIPVLIDFGGVKQVEVKAVSNFTNLGKVLTRLGKKGYAPEEQWRQGQVFPNSDLYALAVTALVLLTGKEPEELYDSYKGTWVWRREISVSSQLETVLQKMLANKSDARYQSAEEVLQALQSPPTSPPPDTNISQMRTVNFVGQKPVPNASYSHQKGGTQVIATHTPHLGWLRPWVTRVAGAGMIVLIGTNGWGLLNSVIRSIQLLPVGHRSPSTSHSSSENTRADKIRDRLKALKINEASFNAQVDELFYAKHPELNKRQLTSRPEDNALREEWYNIAEELVNYK
jgi:serine/threonine-protein kinase